MMREIRERSRSTMLFAATAAAAIAIPCCIALAEGEAAVECGIVVIAHHQQPGKSCVYLLGCEAVRMRMKPVKGSAVLDFEGEGLLRARCDHIKAGTILRFGEGETVEMHGRRLRQAVLNYRVDAVAAVGHQQRVGDGFAAGIGDVSATAGKRIDAFNDQPSQCACRNRGVAGKGWRYCVGLHGSRSPCRRQAQCGDAAGEKMPPVHAVANAA